jgi:predicted DNA-binding protein with PD1-like motif
MKSRILEQNETRTHVLVFASGEEVMAGLRQFARQHDIRAAHFTGIGALQSGMLAYFDWDSRSYQHIPVETQVEVLVLAGDIAWKDDEPVVHAHVVLGRHDGTALGGHLVQATVRPTLEIALTEGAHPLERRYDPESQLSLLAP